MSIGSNIKRRRFQLKMSQDELAKALGYKTRSTIARIESGENNVTLEKLEYFARALDTTVDQLLGTPAAETIKEESVTAGIKNIAIILAGGRSTRNQQNIPNQFINVLGKPVIIYSMEVYQRHPAISEIYVVCLKGWEDILTSYAQQYGITKLKGIIPAGNTGILSARNAVYNIEANNDDILIFQEATRPFTSEEIISKLLTECKAKGNAVTCEPMNDHLQFLNADDVRYINRNLLVEAQTPEAYKYELIKKTMDSAISKKSPFSESIAYMFMYNQGVKLNFMEGNHNNIKIIRQKDIAVFSALVSTR